ncbi:hypothetical protein [Moraxella lacunata]
MPDTGVSAMSSLVVLVVFLAGAFVALTVFLVRVLGFLGSAMSCLFVL